MAKAIPPIPLCALTVFYRAYFTFTMPKNAERRAAISRGFRSIGENTVLGYDAGSVGYRTQTFRSNLSTRIFNGQ